MSIDNSAVMALLARGKSIRQAANVLGVNHHTLWYRISQDNVLKGLVAAQQEERNRRRAAQQTALRGRPLVQIDLARVCDLLHQGHSIRAAARVLGIPQSTLHHRLSARGYALRLKDAQVACDCARIMYRQTHAQLLRLICRVLLCEELYHWLKNESGHGRLFCADPRGKARTCRMCGIAKPLTDYYFHNFSQTYRHACKACYRAQTRAVWHVRGKFNRVRVYRQRPEPLSTTYPYLVNSVVEGAALITAINALVPRGLPDALRADVCQELALAVISGDIALANLAEYVKPYLKRQRQFMPSRYRVSLDAPLYANGNKTLADTLVG